MGEKYRNIMRTPWRRVIDRDFAFCECFENDGVCSLTHIIKTKEPLICVYGGERATIVEDDCFWLQFAPKNENFWITALLLRDGSFEHAYFDMTDFNVIDGACSYFCDLYLDVAIMKSGEAFTLDEDELEAARKVGDIDDAQAERARSAARRVIETFGGENIARLMSLCEKYYGILSPKLSERQIFKMNLTHEPFEKIKSGEKSVELRLFDEKRKRLRVGDVIEFSHGDKTLSAKVVDLYREDCFLHLFEKYPMAEMGFDDGISPAEGAMMMRKYYPKEREEECGALGIKVITTRCLPPTEAAGAAY